MIPFLDRADAIIWHDICDQVTHKYGDNFRWRIDVIGMQEWI